MPSFFLSETLKYLYLLFDDDNFVHDRSYIFSTEAHLFDPGQLPPVIRATDVHTSTHSSSSNASNVGVSFSVDIPIPIPIADQDLDSSEVSDSDKGGKKTKKRQRIITDSDIDNDGEFIVPVSESEKTGVDQGTEGALASSDISDIEIDMPWKCSKKQYWDGIDSYVLNYITPPSETDESSTGAAVSANDVSTGTNTPNTHITNSNSNSDNHQEKKNHKAKLKDKDDKASWSFKKLLATDKSPLSMLFSSLNSMSSSSAGSGSDGSAVEADTVDSDSSDGNGNGRGSITASSNGGRDGMAVDVDVVRFDEYRGMARVTNHMFKISILQKKLEERGSFTGISHKVPGPNSGPSLNANPSPTSLPKAATKDSAGTQKHPKCYKEDHHLGINKPTPLQVRLEELGSYRGVITLCWWCPVLDSPGVLLSYTITSLASPITNILISTLF